MDRNMYRRASSKELEDVGAGRCAAARVIVVASLVGLVGLLGSGVSNAQVESATATAQPATEEQAQPAAEEQAEPNRAAVSSAEMERPARSSSYIVGPSAGNHQVGDNVLRVDQIGSASSGDAVGGQVIGVVTGDGGSTTIIAANRSENVRVRTGDVSVTNANSSFVGQNNTGGGTNYQKGDNVLRVTQTGHATSGDAIAGQVIGVASDGDTYIEASNVSTDIRLETGSANTRNQSNGFAGQNSAGPMDNTTRRASVPAAPSRVDGSAGFVGLNCQPDGLSL